MKIVTDYVYPPIPVRDWDWRAYDDDTYDGSPGQVTGWGRTEQEAIEDFKQRWQDRYDDHPLDEPEPEELESYAEQVCQKLVNP